MPHPDGEENGRSGPLFNPRLSFRERKGSARSHQPVARNSQQILTMRTVASAFEPQFEGAIAMGSVREGR